MRRRATRSCDIGTASARRACRATGAAVTSSAIGMAFVLAGFHLLAEDSGRGAAPAFVLIVAEGETAVDATSAAPTLAVIAVGIAGAVVRVSPGMGGEPLSTAGTTCAGIACSPVRRRCPWPRTCFTEASSATSRWRPQADNRRVLGSACSADAGQQLDNLFWHRHLDIVRNGEFHVAPTRFGTGTLPARLDRGQGRIGVGDVGHR